ncbi:hypothetical protein BDW22DRAFT_966910 [Trametopsis cervina]|nr:hypothetical protein BDW22DRAFT_966910 [Trametopsis cervina]
MSNKSDHKRYGSMLVLLAVVAMDTHLRYMLKPVIEFSYVRLLALLEESPQVAGTIWILMLIILCVPWPCANTGKVSLACQGLWNVCAHINIWKIALS